MTNTSGDATTATSESISSTGRGDPRRAVLVALMLTMALAALDSTIVTTAVPSIVRDLGGFSLFPWLFSIYVLTQAVTIPIYGRMADLFGRKRVLFVGIAIFLVGSVLCATASNMVLLIVYRGLQGCGAGAIAPMVMTVVGDLYNVKERARVQGYTASVWGVASVIGPLIGGSFTEYVNWRWIFYVNLPIGAGAVVMLQRRLHEKLVKKRPQIDYLGGAALTGGLTLIIFGLLQGGVQWRWRSPIELAVLLVGVALLVAFSVIERHTREPMVPPWVLTKRPLVAGCIANIALGAVQIGLTSYIPTYLQGVRRDSPIVAGLTVASITLGWPIASSYAGRLYLRWGFRATALVGSSVSLVGSLMFATVTQSTPIVVIALFGLLTGAGFGFVVTPILVGLQTMVSWSRRGVVTATNQFSRSLGSAVGVAVLGSIANSSIAGWLANRPASISGQLPDSVNSASNVLGNTTSRYSAAATHYLRLGLFHATHDVFFAIAIGALLIFIAVLCVPRRLGSVLFEDEEDVAAPAAVEAPSAVEAAIG
jgi:EmrB/QacA subfamily drug resistance transporter